jgi:hypothetical protein
MRSFLFLLTSSAIINLLCNALPLPGIYELYTNEARDLDDVVRLDARVNGMPVGPGGRYLEDEPTHAQSTRLFNPIPHGTYLETASHLYSASDVNTHAHQFLNSLNGAVTQTSNKQRKAVKTYPKPTSGFRSSESGRDPSHGYELRYHYPMPVQATPGNPPVNPHTAMNVGPDRLVAYRNKTDTHFNIGVIYHDPHLPIPPTSQNHPFSVARQRSQFQVAFTKAKKAFTKPFRAIYRKIKGH